VPPPKLLILSFTYARRNPRIFRQAFHLRKDYTVIVAALADSELEGMIFMPIRHQPAKHFMHCLCVFECKLEVVFSGPEYADLPVSAGAYPPDPSQGGQPGRRLERMIEVMDYVDRCFSLILYLVGKESRLRKLRDLAEAILNIRWQKPVPIRELTRLYNRYDN
jgi:hypothetical protein